MKTGVKLLVLGSMLLMAVKVGAEITEMKDSWEFSHRYEWGSMWYADLDGNGSDDFTSDIRGDSSINRYYGVMRFSSVSNTVCALLNNTSTGSWRTLAPTRASGFTVELRMRVDSQVDAVNGAIGITATASDSNADSLLCVGTNFVKWGWNSASALSEVDNSDDFHIFRIAMEGGQSAGSEKFTVWRDGVFLADGLTDAFGNNGLNRLNIGDISTGLLGGNVDVGYVRFTSGAYAPAHTTKYALKDSAEFDKKFEMNTAEGEVDPNGDTDEWSYSASGDHAAELSGGQLQVATSNINASAFWESVSWTNMISRGDPFTIEVRMRVDESINDSGDRAFMLAAGNGDALAYFTIGTNNVYRGMDVTPLNSDDNSDRMHTFRMAYDADGPAGFQLWRDGVLIGTNITYEAALVNRLYFADNSSSFSGSGSFDYVRWTEGVYEPVPALKGTLILVH